MVQINHDEKREIIMWKSLMRLYCRLLQVCFYFGLTLIGITTVIAVLILFSPLLLLSSWDPDALSAIGEKVIFFTIAAGGIGAMLILLVPGLMPPRYPER